MSKLFKGSHFEHVYLGCMVNLLEHIRHTVTLLHAHTYHMSHTPFELLYMYEFNWV